MMLSYWVDATFRFHLVASHPISFMFDSYAFLTSGQKDDCCIKKTHLRVNGTQRYLVNGSESEIKRCHVWNDIQISKVNDVQHMEDKVKKQRTKTNQHKKNIATESKHYLVKMVTLTFDLKINRVLPLIIINTPTKFCRYPAFHTSNLPKNSLLRWFFLISNIFHHGDLEFWYPNQ